jgi:hypothetical protein
MNNINITNIFANNTLQNNSQQKNQITINEFSVSTLVDSNTFKTSISDDYLINKIKLNKKHEQQKITDLYEEKYKECLIKIDTAVELNMTDIVYTVGLSYFGFPNYSSFDCIKYIEKKLKEKKFLTLIVSPKDIFISWKNIIDSLDC